MKKSVFLPLAFLVAFPIFSWAGNEPIRELVADLVSDDWPVVLAAKEKIENMGSAGIPEMIALMGDCKVEKLKNTGDLIYPGADKFYGHGQIIDFDIDDICVRAGWVLEEITFKDFGFSGIHLPENELSAFIRKNFPDYYAVVENQKKTEGLNEEGKRKLIRALSITQAKSWWETAPKQWTRLSALEQALTGNDEKSQVKALFYLRNGDTFCKGLTQKFYKSRLSKAIEKLSKSETNRVSENAKLIMLDSDFSWLSLKPVN